AAVVGLLCGLATLTRPVAQAFIVFVVAIMIAAGFRDRWRQAVAAALLAAVTFGAVIAPWMFVNSRTYGFWGVSLGTGLGLFARVFMIDKMDPVPHTQYPKVKAALARARARGDGVHGVTRQLRTGTRDTDRAMFGLAFEAVRAHPREYARNSARNWRRLLLRERADPDICQGASGPYLCSSRALGRSTPMFPNVPPEGRPSLKEAIAAWFTAAYTPMWLVVPLAFAGIVLSLLSARIPKPHALLLLAAILYFTAVPALIQYPEERYRLPIDGLLFIFAAAAAVAAVAWLRAAAYRVGLQHPRLHR
ncbi:MAG TPA: hypothetical protein VK864_17730, partial [Longimicrobiales bacterium]|nr:hypothetical protein [Longimicrobiales bacterium]